MSESRQCQNTRDHKGVFEYVLWYLVERRREGMKIIDITEKHEPLYFLCLAEWSDDLKEAGDHKQEWYHKVKHLGLGVKLALDDRGEVGGMIQYMPIEQTHVTGKDLYFIHCIWVHGHKKGRGNFQKRGMGKALLQAAEEDVRSREAKGIAAWGISMPFWMKASWFKRQGYKKAGKDGMAVLLWKPFSDDAEPPQWIKAKKKPEKIAGKVTVSAFKNGWCPVQNLAYERAKRAAEELGEQVAFVEYDTFDRDVFNEWGIVDGIFVDGKRIRTGPPPSYEKIRKIIKKRI